MIAIPGCIALLANGRECLEWCYSIVVIVSHGNLQSLGVILSGPFLDLQGPLFPSVQIAVSQCSMY